MRLHGRGSLIALLTGAAVAVSASAAQAAFGPASFEAGTCVNTTCSYASIEHDKGEAFTQAAGHPPWGITKFELNHSGNNVEGAALKRIRVEVPPGLAADPEALHKCSQEEFRANACLPDTEVGTTELDAVAAETLTLDGLKGKVYNLETPPRPAARLRHQRRTGRRSHRASAALSGRARRLERRLSRVLRN
jgi:hypothetical protein